METKINLFLFYSRIKDEGFKFNFDVSPAFVFVRVKSNDPIKINSSIHENLLFTRQTHKMVKHTQTIICCYRRIVYA